MSYRGDFRVGATVVIPFTTSSTAGGSVAPSSGFEAADVQIFKNATSTPRASTAGVTMTSPFASISALHMLVLDLSNNTDPGFYAAGNEYSVILVPDETISGQSIVKVLATFSIENRSRDTTLGAGSLSWEIIVNDGNADPIPGAEVWISTDEAGTNVVAGTQVTDDFGSVTFLLDPGTYYVWRDKADITFNNPSTIVVA